MSKIEYQIIEDLPKEEVLAWILKISNDAFKNEGSIAEMQQQLIGKRSILTCLAFEGDTPVGFKIGYEERPYYFESWRGGVIQSARRQGIAQQLTHHQHAWCKEQGFRIITTLCSHDNVGMLILNMREGLMITGSYLDRGKHLKLVLQKQL